MQKIKKAKNGDKVVRKTVVDKTAARKPNAPLVLKRENEADLTVQRNAARTHDYHRQLDVAAAMKYPKDADMMMKAARTDDSLATDAKRKARALKVKPRFPQKKSGGKVNKKK